MEAVSVFFPKIFRLKISDGSLLNSEVSIREENFLKRNSDKNNWDDSVTVT